MCGVNCFLFGFEYINFSKLLKCSGDSDDRAEQLAVNCQKCLEIN